MAWNANSGAEACYQITKEFPREEIYGMTSQIRCSAVSIPANVAEGYGRKYPSQFIQFLRIAQGSSSSIPRTNCPGTKR